MGDPQGDNRAKMDKAVADAAGEPAKFMALVMPTGLGIAGPVLTEYGFRADPMGAVAFMLQLQARANEDPALKAQVEELRARMLPMVPAPSA